MKKTVVLMALLSIIFETSSSRAPLAASKEDVPPGCVGVKTCECCHSDVMPGVEKSSMGRLFLKHPRTSTEELVCETCHGQGKAHADSEGASFEGLIRFAKVGQSSATERNAACLRCHERKKLLFWQGSAHQMADVACSDCHKIHTNATPQRKLLTRPTEMETCQPCHKQATAQQLRFSHHPLPEGKMNCSSCHNPHGTTSQSLLKADHSTELCFSCHTEKRGPFLFEHAPVQEDCTECHVAHGSNFDNLLKLPEERSCRQCHTNFHRLTGHPGLRSPQRMVGRACTDCHVNIHGSNHPSGMYFTR